MFLNKQYINMLCLHWSYNRAIFLPSLILHSTTIQKNVFSMLITTLNYTVPYLLKYKCLVLVAQGLHQPPTGLHGLPSPQLALADGSWMAGVSQVSPGWVKTWFLTMFSVCGVSSSKFQVWLVFCIWICLSGFLKSVFVLLGFESFEYLWE